jgi:Arc/MetJ-type ribon-helix-helix transcriptional regulator
LSTTRHCTVRLDRQQHDRILALAIEQNCNPSDVIRAAVDAYLGTATLLTSSHRRLARISEFMQLALDVIISEQYPEFRDRIIANTDKRLEQYHGA